jgi:ElaB/YqjD/DUF883 family membrane-anchored ribosome-binding protein
MVKRWPQVNETRDQPHFLGHLMCSLNLLPQTEPYHLPPRLTGNATNFSEAVMAQVEKSNISELNTDLSKQVAVLREDIATLTAVVAEYSVAQGVHVKALVAERADDLAQSGRAAAESAKGAAKVAYSDAEDAIRANPASAVGMAAGLGFLVGLLTSRR